MHETLALAANLLAIAGTLLTLARETHRARAASNEPCPDTTDPDA